MPLIPIPIPKQAISWISGKLLNSGWSALSKLIEPSQISQCFEKACASAAEEFPQFFTEHTHASFEESPDPEDKNLEARLKAIVDTHNFPTIEQISALLMESWRRRKATLSPEAAAPIFATDEKDIQPFIDRLSAYFFKELASIDQIRNPAMLSQLAEVHRVLTTPKSGTSGFSLSPINGQGMNTIRNVEDNREENGRFFCSIALSLLPGDHSIDLLAFEANYFVDGCRCMDVEQTLKLGPETLPTIIDCKTLVTPTRLPVSGTRISYSKTLRPPLMQDLPQDCDYGDLEVWIQFREANHLEIQKKTVFFQFLPGGILRPIAAIRPVPRLNDEELARCLQQNSITHDLFSRLMQIPATRRYLGARAENGSGYVDHPALLRALRELLAKPPC